MTPSVSSLGASTMFRRAFAVGIVALGSVASSALAQTTTTAGPSLPPNPNLDAPVIHCSWPLVGNVIPATETTPESFAYQVDDDTVTPRSNAGAPCKVDEQGVVKQRADAAGMLQLKNDAAIGRSLRLWAAVSDPVGDAFGNGSALVNWTVQRPDGSLYDPVLPSGRSCEGASGPGAIWRAASAPALEVPPLTEVGAATFSGLGSGAFGPKAVINPDGSGLWQRCRQGQVRVFFGKWTLPGDAECGKYTVLTKASKGEMVTELTYSFEVLCEADATLDTTNIHWTLAPGEFSVQKGDFDPATTDVATVTNQSKSPMQLGVRFTPLSQPSSEPAPGTTISEFGVVIYHVDETFSAAPRIPAATDFWVDGDAAIVCPGESVRIDVRAYAPAELQPGEYSGSIQLLSRTGGRC